MFTKIVPLDTGETYRIFAFTLSLLCVFSVGGGGAAVLFPEVVGKMRDAQIPAAFREFAYGQRCFHEQLRTFLQPEELDVLMRRMPRLLFEAADEVIQADVGDARQFVHLYIRIIIPRDIFAGLRDAVFTRRVGKVCLRAPEDERNEQREVIAGHRLVAGPFFPEFGLDLL